MVQKSKAKELFELIGMIEETSGQKKPRLSRKKKSSSTNETETTDIGASIKRKRVALGYTQKQLSEKAKVGFDTLRKIEQGETKVQLALILKVMGFLDLKIEVKDL